MGWGSRSRLTVLALGLYLGLTGMLFLVARARTGGSFVAPQDDPYIHLAMAERMRQGHYGINLGEASSPSSSLLWPVLLLPLAGTAWGLDGALAWNLLAGCVAAGLLARVVAEWPAAGLLGGAAGERWRRPVGVAALVMLANLVVLTLLSMEHTLQVMLAVACAAGMCRVLRGRAMPWWSVAAAVVAPWLRYEDLTLTMAVVVMLWALGRRRTAVGAVVGAVLPLVGFSVFLHRLGLPWLPVSVLVKSETAAAVGGVAARGWQVVEAGVVGAARAPLRWPLLLVFAALVWVAWRERPGLRRVVAGAVATAAGLHLVIGRFGWFYRYEVYITIFATVVLLRLVTERVRVGAAMYGLGALALAAVYARGLPEAPRAAAEIYGQQAQMHRFVTEFYHGGFAVNDLGEVSYRHGDAYVLDLFGLSSVEAARQREKTPAWAEGIVRRRGVGLVMMYPELLRPPASWVRVGSMCLERRVTAIGDRCVLFFAADPSQAGVIAGEFRAFARTLPAGTVAGP